MHRSRYFFDWSNYWTMLRLVRRETDAKRRRGQYLTMLVLVPAMAGVNAICFALDPVVFPSLRRTEVRAPVFTVGHARSGTTYLHRLMAADPQFSTVLLWEMFFPSLIQKRLLRLLFRLDARTGSRLRRRIEVAEEAQVGEFRGMHDTGFFKAEEDDFLLTMSCSSGFWIVLFPYMRELDFYSVDTWSDHKRRRMMAFYRECVRRQTHLNGGSVTHLSKNPTFCGRVEALLEAFPDARFVVQVRNPYETIPSLLKMLQVGWRARGRDEEHIRDSLRILADQSFHSYEYPLAFVESHPEVPSIVVEYRDLIADPDGTVQRVYAALDLLQRPTSLNSTRSGPGNEHKSTHEYSLGEFGLSADEIHTHLAPLFERFGWDETETSHVR